MELTAISGVGEKTAASLSELDDPERALREGDVAALSAAPGVTEGRAARIARAAIRQRHDDPGEFLATDRAREIYREVLGLLQARAVTTYAEKRLETFYPSAAASRIEEVRAFAEEAMARDPDEAVADTLAGVEPLSPSTDVQVRDRCLATTDAETYSAAREAVPEVSVEVVEDARDLAELARGYATVVALDEAFAGVDVDGDVRVEPDALDEPEAVVPERTLSFFAANREPLQAAARIHREAGLDAPTDLDALEAALSRVDEDGAVRGDDELDRLSAAVEELEPAVSTAESVANDRLREAIREQDVTIEGADLLSLVEQGAGVDSLLSRELTSEFEAAVAAAREHLTDALALEGTEADLARRVFPDRPTFPVERDEDAAGRLRDELQAERDRRAASLKRELAAQLADERAAAGTLVRNALELDVELAVARFARDFGSTMPDIGGQGIAVEGGRSPLLDEPFEAVEPVDYEVGGVTLLSGVNSGGKTSLLDLLAAVVVLAHMGLPVPADAARVEHFEELHYHAATQGTLDAGAFESTLRQFGDLVAGDRGRLVLVDELESITEPGASAVIMAGILEELRAEDATSVFVSHLAGEIREEADFDVQVDGIEAKGLEDGELVVERSPRANHLARSTPELIVEKLAGEADTEGFYRGLLEKFRVDE
ncbi:MAG: helix-hairpin-helix domain-containing protein [Halobacteriales archaeon]